MIPNRSFALAGNATFTALSKKTGNRFTFKVAKGKKEGAPHFVSVLTGNDNESDYTCLGTIFDGRNYRHNSNRSPISAQAPSAQAFAYVWDNLDAPNPEKLEIFHEGKCCRCGRKLTTPESIEMGIGPECAKRD